MTEPEEPLWYLRVNTLRRTRLSDPSLRGLLGELAEAERAVHAAAVPCSDELYDLIGATGDESARRRLVALRRAIHNDRAAAVDETPTPAVRAWQTARERRQSLRDEVTRTYDAAAGRERVTLANLLGDEDLRCALALVAPEVYRESERYRSAVGGPGSVPARVRKAERGLLQYVTRAMVRTSPLSRFTAVGIAVPGAEGIDPGAVRFEKATAFPLLDRVMLGYVLGGLNTPDGFLDAWVGLSPTSIPEEDKLILLRATETGILRVAVALTGPVRLLLEMVGMGPRPVRSVIAGLVDRLGCPPEKAAGLLHTVVGQGILCTFGEAEDSGADLAAILARPRPGAADLLDTVRTGLPRLATAPAAERGAELDAINTDLAALSRLAGRPARISVDEDYVIPPRKVATAGWREPLADLAAAVELLSVFDLLHDVRAVLAASFVERFGAGATVPLAEHAGFLVGEVSRRTAALDAAFRAGESLPDVGPADGCVESLYAVRRQVTDALLDAFAKAGDEPEVGLPIADVLELTADLPDRFRRPPLLYGILVQQWDDRLIFNDGLPGHGMLYGRFLGADRDLGGQASPRLARRLSRHYGRDGSTVVEDLGLHRLAINAHPPVLPEGLRADDWFSLRLKHEPETDLLRVVDTDGRDLAVLHLGTGHPGLFPPPLSVASALVMSGRLYNDLPNIRHRNTPWDGRQTRSCPRMAVGTAVISRRRWYGGAELAEAVAAGPGEADRLLALTAWRARHGVPEEVVVKTAPAQAGMALDAPDLGTDRLQQKPQYVDLTSALGARVLPRMLERRAAEGSTDYLEEAAPAVTDGTYAAEWVVEIGRRPGGLFEYGGEFG